VWIPQPLRIYIGPENEVITFNNQPLHYLTAFELRAYTDAITHSFYSCSNCFPIPSSTTTQFLLSNVDFPLRIYTGPTSEEHTLQTTTYVWFKGRPITHIQHLYIRLHIDEKRKVCLELIKELPNEVLITLLDLGVEVNVNYVPIADPL
jgi:hypothetical protein